MDSDSSFAMRPLGDVAFFVNGDRGKNYPKECDFVPNGLPFISATDIATGRLDLASTKTISRTAFDRLGNGKIKQGDLLYCLRGSVGKSAMVTDDVEGAVASSLVIIRANDFADTRYIRYLLISEVGQAIARGLNNGSVQPNISVRDLKQATFPTPPLEVQLEIISSVSPLDDRIDLLRQTNTTLEAIAQALFKSWFVDFDAVHAKAEGREPEAMDAATAALFPSEFDESELGLIPKGWRAGTLADFTALNASKWTARKHPTTIRYIDLSGVSSNRIDGEIEYAFEDAPSRARNHLRDGDTIVGTVRPGNRAFAYVSEAEPNLTGSTGFAVLSPISDHLSSFVYLAATRDESISRLANLADGGAYPAVRPTVVAETSCVIPDDETLRVFSGLTKPMMERIGKNRETAANLADLRDTLLPRLISGKLRLPEVAF